MQQMGYIPGAVDSIPEIAFMAEKHADEEASAAQQTLGDFLSYVRISKKLTLREVEEATNGAVSNAYLSQL